MRLHIRPNDFTLGDLEDFEEFTGGLDLFKALEGHVVRCTGEFECEYPHEHREGRPVTVLNEETGKDEVVKEPDISTKVLLGLIFLVARKDNPAVTRADIRAMKVTEVEIDWGEDKSQDPPTTSDEKPEGVV